MCGDKSRIMKAFRDERKNKIESTKEIVHCEHCTVKKAVQHKDGIVWRCPHRTGDVKMDGFCESGVRGDGDLGRMGRSGV